jgi:hypothetical protein
MDKAMVTFQSRSGVAHVGFFAKRRLAPITTSLPLSRLMDSRDVEKPMMGVVV